MFASSFCDAEGDVSFGVVAVSDLDDLPAEVREKMAFHPVSRLGEVLAIALRGASLREGSLFFPEHVHVPPSYGTYNM